MPLGLSKTISRVAQWFLMQLELAHGSAVSFEMHITPNGHAITHSCP